MNKVTTLFRSFFDVRPGEYGRTLFMSLYLLLVLLAYYILKPVSRALFLTKFDIDKLPWLYVLIAVAGGILAYGYTKVAVRFSLNTAVTGAMIFSIAMQVLIWWLIALNKPWVFYFFNIWTSLFSVMLVSQGWLVAANVFTPREARRLYGLLGAGSVIGAAFGGEFTARAVKYLAPRDLLLASAGFVVLAYIAFRLTAAQKGVDLRNAKGAESEEANVGFKEILGPIKNQRHLQVIVGIMILTFIVDVSIEYQFNAYAKLAFKGHHSAAELTAFLGNFYGIYLNLVTIVLQVVFTAFVVQRLGVGGTLQVMPVTIAVTSVATFFFSGVWAAGALRLTEAATRYTLNRTGMELLYVPLPLELKNRTKAFIDIFVDRFGRGVGGMLLVLFTSVLGFSPRLIALVTAGFTIPWIILSHLASKEYVATVRRRLSSRRLDFKEARVDASDVRTVRLVEEAANGDNPRQVAYAISLLAEVEGYDLLTLLKRHAANPAGMVRRKVFEIATERRLAGLEDSARNELTRGDEMAESAVGYLLATAKEPAVLMGELLGSGSRIAEAAVHAPGGGSGAVQLEWIAAAARDRDAVRRHLAAAALSLTGERGLPVLRSLLQDSDIEVVREAVCTAGKLHAPEMVSALIPLLAKTSIRAEVLEALAAYGDSICGTLSGLMDDESLPLNIRIQVPRSLKLVRTQASVDVLVKAIGHGDLAIRASVLKALNSIRNRTKGLDFHEAFVTQQILAEARYYFQLNAAMAPFAQKGKPSTATGLVARTIEQRLGETVERLFRLLGLRYQPAEIYSAYLAYRNRRGEEMATAIEFLDNTLDRDLKRVVLPMLDESDHLPELGRRLYGFEPYDAETALREIIGTRDPWLVACATAAAGEMNREVMA
jgi:ATP/ADP translocase